jgi:hypothetical protein
VRHNISLADEAFKNAFVAGEFVIDCVEIKLTRNGPGDPAAYTACGSLEVSPTNGAKARLVLPRDPSIPYDPLAKLHELSSYELGKIVPDHHYFALAATDMSGRVWSHPSAEVKVASENEASIVLTVESDYLRWESKLDKPEAGVAAMVFMEDMPFPDRASTAPTEFKQAKRPAMASAKASIGMVTGMVVTFDHRLERPGRQFFEMFIEAEDCGPLPEEFEERMLEAARFCAAMVTSPVMTETHRGETRVVELAKFRPSNRGGVVLPPLAATGYEASFHALMERYYEYASAKAKGGSFAPLSAKISGLFALQGVFIDTVALLLTVAVESVLNEDHFTALGQPDAGTLAQVDKLLAHTKAAVAVDPKLIDRGVSAIGGMKSTRAADKLHALAVAGLTSEEDRATWKKLRDNAAHGSFKVDPAKLQELYDDVWRLNTLLYKLVFLEIGYTGKFSNRAVAGWPVQGFSPLPAIAPASAAPSAPTPAP